MPEANYWWAEHDPENALSRDYPWRPTLQVGSGMCISLEGVSFGSEADCLDFIRTEIIGATLEREDTPSTVHVTFTSSSEMVAEAVQHLRDAINRQTRRQRGDE